MSIVEAVAFELPMNVLFRGITSRQGLLIRGDAGWAEFSPFVEYDDEEASAWLAAALEAADTAYPEPIRTRVPVNCTIPAVGPERAAALVAASNGCRTAKVKVAEPGQTLSDDVDRVAAVRDALGPTGHVRVDANGGWSVGEAVASIGRLSEFDLEYVEQPSRSVEELREVRSRVDVPIAADESIRKATDPLLVRDHEAADIAVLKVQPLGGVRSCLRLAEEIGLPVVVSSALESSVGIASGVALAAALPELPYACGLATTSMLTHDLVADPLLVVDGSLDVQRPEVDIGTLRNTAISDDAAAWWLERLARCQALLEDRRR
jgi:O-succinylbenzoate synthase